VSSIRVEKVASKQQLADFIKFQWKVYGNHPHWVPPLLMERKEFFDPDKNPFYEHAEVNHYLAFKDGRIAGRISSLVNHRHNEFHQDKSGFFGFFECFNDRETASALFNTAAEFLRNKGMNRMIGPCNYSTNEEVGFLAHGFDSPPTIMNPYTPEYYLDLAEEYGMTKAKDLLGFYLHKDIGIPERMLGITEKIIKRADLTIRNVNLKNLREEVERVKIVYEKAWEKNWGFVPLTEAELDHMADNFKMIVDPHIVFFAEVKGEPVGFSLSLPNMNEIFKALNGRLFPFGIVRLLFNTRIRRTIKGIRTLLMGMIPEYRGRGIDNIFYVETIRRAVARGYEWSEMGWILEDNEMMLKALEHLGARPFKRYRLYQIDI
jgi:GNAT superfamily N-acetyltransferase